MNTPSEIVLRIDTKAEHARITSVTDGIASSKLVSYSDLTNCFRDSIIQKETNSGLLPSGCLSFSKKGDGLRSVTLLFPERSIDYTYHKTIYSNFPLPRLVFRFFVHEGHRVGKVMMGIIEEGRISPNTKMFHYPFSNVSGFLLCTGVNMLPKYESLHGISTLPYLIMEMPNNDDYFNSSYNKGKMEHRTLLEHLKDKDPSYYYSNVLLPSGKTLNDFIMFSYI